MTATSDSFSGNFFELIEAQSNTKYCDICKNHLARTADYRHTKSEIQLTSLCKECFI